MIKIPSNISFQIGIIDAWGNQSYVDFPSNQTTYGLTRDGNWGQASIPINDISGEFIDLRMLSYEFVILEVNGNACEFALDDIFWDEGESLNLIGDLNADGMLNILDIVIIANNILNDNYNVIADLNEDGLLNILDIVALVNIILNN
tara:strand:- start:696 stop:1136 length:441 start_codon:yes stop_codon:yes gene_type:complete